MEYIMEYIYYYMEHNNIWNIWNIEYDPSYSKKKYICICVHICKQVGKRLLQDTLYSGYHEEEECNWDMGKRNILCFNPYNSVFFQSFKIVAIP